MKIYLVFEALQDQSGEILWGAYDSKEKAAERILKIQEHDSWYADKEFSITTAEVQ